MKKINLNKKNTDSNTYSTEFGTYHEYDNEINSNYDSLDDYSTCKKEKSNEKNESSKKEGCHDKGCRSKLENKNLNR
jgi:hypothetical protein